MFLSRLWSRLFPWLLLGSGGPLLVTLCGALMILIYWLPGESVDVSRLEWSTRILGYGADPSRFLLQGKWLAEGCGFREVTPDGALCTSLPPGHPLVIAGLSLLTSHTTVYRWVQATLLILSGLIFLFSVRRLTPVWALAGAVLIGASPWAAALSTCYMSETTGVLLAAIVMALFLKSLNSAPSAIYSFLLGFCCVYVCLTSPGTAPVAFTVVCIHLYYFRRCRATCLGCVAGVLIPMTVWQAHCVAATGRPAPLLLHALGPQSGRPWIATWARTEKEYALGLGTFVWATDIPDFSGIPDYAFHDQAHRRHVEELVTKSILSEGSFQNQTPEFQEKTRYFDELAIVERQNHPFRNYILLPLQRSVSSWVDYRDVDFRRLEAPEESRRLLPTVFLQDIREHGIARATKRLGRAGLSLYAIGQHVALMVCTVVIVGLVIRSRQWLPIAVLCSIFAFLFLHGYAGPEARRNLPLVPFLLALPSVVRAARISQATCASVPTDDCQLTTAILT